MFVLFFVWIHSKMINLSVPDTIDERTINKKKLTPFTIQVSWIYISAAFSKLFFICVTTQLMLYVPYRRISTWP